MVLAQIKPLLCVVCAFTTCFSGVPMARSWSLPIVSEVLLFGFCTKSAALNELGGDVRIILTLEVKMRVISI